MNIIKLKNNNIIKNLDFYKTEVLKVKELLLSKKGEGCEFLGWLDLPLNYDKEEFDKILKTSKYIRENNDAFVVIGIGGSYLGAKASDCFLNGIFSNNKIDIYYVGNNLSSDYINEVIEKVKNKNFSINVISKSGSTLESSVSFRIFKKILENKYNKEEVKKRIYITTTNNEKSILKNISDKNGYDLFNIPENIGGRFSVLTSVGLLPMAVSGIDIESLMLGARDERESCIHNDYDNNYSLQYSLFRYYFYNNGKNIEVLSNNDPHLHYIGEWWKQLFGESEGKNGKGLFPASIDLTTDLHSLGQYIQDGKRSLIETMLILDEQVNNIIIEKEDNDFDKLNYLSGKSLSFINECAQKGTLKAHSSNNVPCIEIHCNKRNSYNLGALFYFFEFSVAISGYMLKINPFNQPGVEKYKKNMFDLLG